MPDYVIFNPSSTPVANLVTGYLKSWPEEREGELGPNILKNPDVSGIDRTKPAKVVGGTTVENLSQAEIDAINAANEATEKAAIKQAAKDIYLDPSTPENHAIKLGFQTFSEMMLGEINALRAAVVPALPARTQAQLNNAFKATYEAKVDAL